MFGPTTCTPKAHKGVRGARARADHPGVRSHRVKLLMWRCACMLSALLSVAVDASTQGQIGNLTASLRKAWLAKLSRSREGQLTEVYTGPLLTADEMERGTSAQSLTKSDMELACVHRRLLAGLPLTMGALGGSNTAGKVSGSMGEASHLYHGLVTVALNALYPTGANSSAPAGARRRPSGRLTRRDHRTTNGGVPQLGPTYHELCGVARHLPTKPGTPHLVLLDVAVNMPINVQLDDPALVLHAHSLERLLRQLRRHPARPAIVAANIHRWHHDRRRNATAAEQVITRLCKHYAVPVVSLHAALGGSVASHAREWTEFMLPDGKHLRPESHAFLAQLILRLVVPPRDRPLAACSMPPDGSTLTESGGAGLFGHALPPPLLLEAREQSLRCAGLCLDDATSLRAHVAADNGFSADEGGAVGRANKLSSSGYVTRRPNATLELRFCCAASILFLIHYVGPTLGGAIRTCHGSCTCEPRTLRAQWPKYEWHTTHPLALEAATAIVSTAPSVTPTGGASGDLGSGACCTVRLQAFALPPLPACPPPVPKGATRPRGAQKPCSNATANGELFKLVGAIVAPQSGLSQVQAGRFRTALWSSRNLRVQGDRSFQA